MYSQPYITLHYLTCLRLSHQFNSLTCLIRTYRQVKVASPEESGRIVAHENVYFSKTGSYQRTNLKLADENAKC